MLICLQTTHSGFATCRRQRRGCTKVLTAKLPHTSAGASLKNTSIWRTIPTAYSPCLALNAGSASTRPLRGGFSGWSSGRGSLPRRISILAKSSPGLCPRTRSVRITLPTVYGLRLTRKISRNILIPKRLQNRTTTIQRTRVKRTAQFSARSHSRCRHPSC